MRRTALFALVVSLLVPAAALAQGSAAGEAAAKACEDEVEQTVKRMRDGVTAVQFVGSKRVLAAISDDETGINGEGRWRNRGGGATAFTYSCTYNAANNTTSGVLFRERRGLDTAALAPAAARGARAPALAADAPIRSTEACESAVVQALQDKHPRAAGIVFGSDSRRLAPAAEARTTLEGEGALQRAPGMNREKFSYRCLFDPRSGRVERVSLAE